MVEPFSFDMTSSSETNYKDAHRIAFKAFDTVVVIDFWGDAEDCDDAAVEMRVFCAKCERLLSRTLPGSDISRLNSARGEWVDIDASTAVLLARALEYCRASRGRFDITVGSLVGKWDFKNGIIPDAGQLAEAARDVDWHAVEVDVGGAKARLLNPNSQVDLGGIAKGWIADRLRDVAAGGRYKLTGMVANLGGNVIMWGSKDDGSPWMIGVRDPWNPSCDIASIPLRSGSVVTSGVYERSFEHDGITYHHVLDPKTGWPVTTDLASATLVCQDSIDAEGFSTTVLAMGKAEGSAFVRDNLCIHHACLIGNDREIILF